MVCILIFKEVIEIFSEFIISKKEEIEFETFQMKYEQTFKEYIIKWILALYNDNLERKYSSEEINRIFQKSLQKGEQIYSEFSHFGLHIYKEEGITQIVNYLLKQEFLTISKEKLIDITEKGKYLYEFFYSGQLIEDVKDPFDFFFEHRHDTINILNRKKELIQKFDDLSK